MRRSRRTTRPHNVQARPRLRDAEVGIVTDDGKGKFVGYRFADETSTGVKKLLHGTSSFGFDAGGGQHCGTAGTGRKPATSNISLTENVNPARGPLSACGTSQSGYGMNALEFSRVHCVITISSNRLATQRIQACGLNPYNDGMNSKSAEEKHGRTTATI